MIVFVMPDSLLLVAMWLPAAMARFVVAGVFLCFCCFLMLSCSCLSVFVMSDQRMLWLTSISYILLVLIFYAHINNCLFCLDDFLSS